jgi:hypothetical protein
VTKELMTQIEAGIFSRVEKVFPDARVSVQHKYPEQGSPEWVIRVTLYRKNQPICDEQFIHSMFMPLEILPEVAATAAIRNLCKFMG